MWLLRGRAGVSEGDEREGVGKGGFWYGRGS